MGNEEKKKVDFSVVRTTVGEYWADHTVGTMDITEWHEARDEAIKRFDEMLEEYKKEVIADFINDQPPFVQTALHHFRMTMEERPDGRTST